MRKAIFASLILFACSASMAALPGSIADREQQKFTSDSSGNVAVRIIADGVIYADGISINTLDGSIKSNIYADPAIYLDRHTNGIEIDKALYIDGSKAILDPTTTDSAYAQSYVFDSDNTLATRGSRAFMVKANGSEAFTVGKQVGDLYSGVSWSSATTWLALNVTGASARFDINSGSNGIYLQTSGPISLTGYSTMARTGDATSTATQKDSYRMNFAAHLWNGSSAYTNYISIRQMASTTVNGSSRLGFVFNSTAAGSDSGGFTEYMSIKNDGNIGLSTISPSATLDVNGTTKLRGTRRATGGVVPNGASTFTLTAANIAKNANFVHVFSSPASTFTLDTGTNLAAAVPGIAVGDEIPFRVSNNSSNTVTMAGATGTTLGGAFTVASLQSREFTATYISTNAFTIN